MWFLLVQALQKRLVPQQVFHFIFFHFIFYLASLQLNLSMRLLVLQRVHYTLHYFMVFTWLCLLMGSKKQNFHQSALKPVAAVSASQQPLMMVLTGELQT